MTQVEVINNDTTNDLEQVVINGEKFLKISEANQLRPFFMSIVSYSNHWLFISSNGGLTAGRRNSESALFPYYTDDKITESYLTTGSKTLIKLIGPEGNNYWEPFTNKSIEKYKISRNLYKNSYGNKVIFEEINHSLNLQFTYQLSTSDQYGFIKNSSLTNLNSATVEIEVIDGFQNILPASVDSELQKQSSNLVDAYKRSELDKKSGLGIFALSAIPVDKAEPSEALKANIAWSLGLENPKFLLSSVQLDQFRSGQIIQEETDVKAEKGAYLTHQNLVLHAEENKQWKIIADVDYNHAKLIQLQNNLIAQTSIEEQLHQDIEKGTNRLKQLVAGADGIQFSQDSLKDIRHFSNSLFNIMRGGVFDHNYQIEKADFTNYLQNANKKLAKNWHAEVQSLNQVFSKFDLDQLIKYLDDADFTRLATEYLPLKFSRRHGDPSRPWNKFSINTKDKNGNKILDYEGNWRDIFQNWESLAYSYPAFIEGMLFKFLNATTFDGYNPYRVTKGGFDWETIEPDDPWSYIGYWGDHQIIYLLKFLEFYQASQPKAMQEWFGKEVFVYAKVPYVIKAYDELVKDPKDTIEFDHELDQKIRAKRNKIGADGALFETKEGGVLKVNFLEKILATSLAKMANFIPEAGIWMNTQRPEWNDANNALVGNGVSLVTLAYLRRFFNFFNQVFSHYNQSENFEVSEELVALFEATHSVLEKHHQLLENGFSNKQRKAVLDGLGIPASNYRAAIYQNGFSGKKRGLSTEKLQNFVSVCLDYLDQSIKVNERQDELYHGYNLVSITQDEIQINRLQEMLEGQVAVLSSGTLSAEKSLRLLDALKSSALFRKDQYSYLLYPNKELKGFLERNKIPKNLVHSSKLLMQMIDLKDASVIEKDVNGAYHFNPNFNNAKKLQQAIEILSEDQYSVSEEEKDKILSIYEEVFNHKAFTGRSGTFYGYEGLGSIYWHMVSKLQLAVQETCFQAISKKASAETVGRLLEHYYEINAGIGVHKSPALYGAFPTDPYSHTPYGKGAQQPGMTGQVKEDVLCRFGELGLKIEAGKLIFSPNLLRKEEFLSHASKVEYFDLDNQLHTLDLFQHQLFFTFCQVPVVYEMSTENNIQITFNSGKKVQIEGNELSQEFTKKIAKRTGEIHHLKVAINKEILK